MGGVQKGRRLAGPAILFLTLALACGCGRSTEETTDGPAQSPPVALPGPARAKQVPSCALLPPAEVAAALGLEDVQVPEAEIRGSVTTCTYAGDGSAARVSLRFEIEASASSLAAARAELEAAGQRVTDVAGLGDRGFAAAGGDGRRTLTFLVGAVQVAIGSTDPLTRQKKLAARVIERLRR